MRQALHSMAKISISHSFKDCESPFIQALVRTYLKYLPTNTILTSLTPEALFLLAPAASFASVYLGLIIIPLGTFGLYPFGLRL